MEEGSFCLLPRPHTLTPTHRRHKGYHLSSSLFLLLGLFVCCGGGARGQDASQGLSTDVITGLTYAGRADASVPVESGSLSNRISTSAKFYVLPFFGPTSGGTWVRSVSLSYLGPCSCYPTLSERGASLSMDQKYEKTTHYNATHVSSSNGSHVESHGLGSS